MRNLLKRLLRSLRPSRGKLKLIVDNGNPYHLLSSDELRRRSTFHPKAFRRHR